jgi:acetyltransferase-like isoleucine patch superfamily enzyme
VVGAGTVVTKEFSEYDILVGNPAKIINNRKTI